MTATATPATVQDNEGFPLHQEDEGGFSMTVMGTVIFLASEVMFFATLLGSYYTLRAVNADSWPPEGIEPEWPLPLLMTATLLVSSVSIHGAVWAVRRDNRTVLTSALAITVLLGVMFMVGEIFEFSIAEFDFEGWKDGPPKGVAEGIVPGAYGSMFWTILAFHGLHVSGGIILNSYILFSALNGRFSSKNYQVLESASYYWHFVDVVWLIVFVTLYVVK